MRNLTILVLVLLLIPFSGKMQDNSGNQQANLFNPNPPAYKKGTVIVRFKNDFQVNIKSSKGVVKTGLNAVDLLSEKWKVTKMTPVFRSAKKNNDSQVITLPDGQSKQLEQLFNIYTLKFPEATDVHAVLQDYKSLPEVEYAELNGTAAIVGGIPASEPFAVPENTSGGQSMTLITPNDPLYSQQWAIPYVKADSLWSYTTGDTTQVIGILDTGIDWLHPDLVNKMWSNTGEIPANGIDDDGNGFIDDIRGWDFVNDDNNPRDDNSHGTHCAGIAAAETNNGIGIAGVSWGAKVMAVKVFQSDGTGYFDQIAEGIWYAAQNGCTIFSNSWGGSFESVTVRLALEYAYSQGLIVASAGNDYYKVDQPCPPWPPYVPKYPASYNWVLGVEATVQNGDNAWFSNFDPTGPVISDGRPYGSIFYNDYEYNYEMRAPGVNILSTVPNGQYRYFNGTSMACPIVAGSIALMKSYSPTLSNEMVFAKLIQLNKINKFQAGVMNIKKSTLNDPPPDIYYKTFSVSDSLGDKDGRVDAGETIGLFLKIKNAGGLVNPVWAKIAFSEFEDTTVANILADSCSFGSLGPYASNTAISPLTMSIDPNLADGRHISFKVFIICNINSIPDTVFQNLTLVVEHGLEIKGFYSSLHLKANMYYLVTEPAVVDTLVIDPGVTLRFKSAGYLVANAMLMAIGKPDSMITFKGAPGCLYRGITLSANCNNEFSYCIFEDGYTPYTNYFLVNPSKIYHSIFRNNPSTVLFRTKTGGDYKYNVFTNNHTDSYGGFAMIMYWGACDFKYNVLSNNIIHNSPSYLGAALEFYIAPYPENMSRTKHNVFMNNIKENSFDCGLASWNGLPMGVYYIDTNYWGTTVQNDIRSHILDFFENPQAPVLEPRNNLISPSPKCHGVVWKILINNQNPQEISTQMVVSGTIKFDVYFNRPMDVSVPPFVTFGVRAPYTQNLVSDSAHWSADSTIWTGYYTTQLNTGDGENTLRVAYARDTDHFEIPIEDSRFKFVVQVAGSQSIDFTATPGIGKVALEWHKDDSLNTLGYNIYRYRMPTDSTFTDTTKINNELITDTTYTDYAVSPGLTYHYMYTITGTDFHESDYSKVVQATPFDATNGDANGDVTVNVLDITAVIAYMLNQNPQPFLFDAADVNADHVINVLDIISIVDIILGKKSMVSSTNSANINPAYIWLDKDRIRFESDGQVAAMQLELSGENLEQIRLLLSQQGFEFATGIVNGKLMGIIYNLGTRTISQGMLDLICIEGNTKPLTWGEVIAGDLNGQYVKVIKDKKASHQLMDFELSAFPNPFRETVTITYALPEPASIEIKVYNTEGKIIKVLEFGEKESGTHQLEWIGKGVPAGVYFGRLNGKTKLGKEFENEVKMVLIK